MTTSDEYITVSVCPNAEWRDAPFAGDPLTFNEFNVTSDDFDFGAYGEDLAKKNAMTLAFFALALVFLILFYLWRTLRFCCVLVCCSDSCDSRRQKNSDILWTKRAAFLKILIILSSLTAICLAAYSSSNLEITLSADAWKTIHAVKAQIEKVLAFGDTVVSDLDETVSLLRTVSTVFQTEVNITRINMTITCIGGFLDNMSDPTSLRDSLLSIDNLLTVTLTNEIANLNTALDGLQTDSLDVISAPIGDLVSAQSSFTTFATELQSLEDAIDSLVPDHDLQPTAAQTSANDVETARSGVRDITSFVSELNSLKASLNTLATTDVTSTITDVENSIAAISTSFDSATTSVTAVEAELNNFQDEYLIVAPCISDFNSTLNYISTDVIDLPSEVTANRQSLDGVAGPLSSFFGEGSDADTALQSLTEFSGRTFLPDASTFLGELDTAKNNIGDIASDADSFDDDIDALIDLLNAFATPMDTLESLLSTYLASPTSTSYDALLAHALPLRIPISELVENIGNITTKFADTFDSANGIASIESSLGSNLDAQRDDLTNVQDLIDELPSLTDIASALDDAAAGHASLGATPSDSISDAKDTLAEVGTEVDSTLVEVIGTVTETTDGARTALAEAREDSVEEIDDFENEKRNLSVNHFLSTPEDLGFALLADDVNDKLYIVTLCFYCVTIVFCLALITFVMANCQFGIGLSLFFFIVLLNFYFLIGIFSSTILAVENDFCANLEEIVLNENSDPELNGLLEYYFTDSGSLRQVLSDAFNLNLTDLEAESANSANSSRSLIIEWGTKGNLNDSLNAVMEKLNDITGRIGELEHLFSYAEMNSLYRIIKSFFCCDISSFLYTVWRDLTTTGAISLLVVFLGFFALHKIDKMPRADCCGCSCRRRYLDDILADAEDIKMSPKQKIGPIPGPSRKGTQIGTEIV